MLRFWILFVLVFAACRTPRLLELRDESLIQDLLKTEFPSDGDPVQSKEIFRNRFSSYHLLEVRGDVEPNYHRLHEESVYLIEGKGILNLAQEEFPIQEGSFIRIPVGMVHSFRPEGRVRALAIFSPPFDGQDRVLVR